MNPLRIGTLGAARITPMALIRPVAACPDATVVAVAARDRSRAERFAAKRGIPKVAESYEALLADPEIDAIYNPLPNALHARWTIAALEAGKHVLCEKPFTSNAPEAVAVADVAERTGLVVMEAFHWRYHPMAQRMIDIVVSGEIGELERVETSMCIPLPLPRDIRWRLDLAGGAGMDVGAYTSHMARHLAGEEPTVVKARAKVVRPGVDRWLRSELSYPSGATGRMTCSMMSSRLVDIRARVVGTKGELRARNPAAPQLLGRLTVRTGSGRRREPVPRRHTYAYQLDAFVAAVRDGAPYPTPPSDSIATMTLIDSTYRAAGLQPRPSIGN